ncbi:LexA family transcriptional regulator [uncultured Ruminococcus sp.]|uniref:LexA family protein n=1 Tax=uncultured Ruminococcus sp. TaxID=165186 RepID=UPI0025EBFE7E|nr:XRE family transcriptional regulator [uncultured Ruminococcus sp.]
MKTGERIRRAREKKEVTQQELADAVGTTKQNIYKYENGIVTNIPSDNIEKIAAYLRVSPGYLMGWEEESIFDQFDNIKPIKLKRYHLLGDIACGEPIFADEDKESYIMVDMDIRADFCLRAKGDSMIGARIQDGDIVFIRSRPMVDNGDIAAVIIDGEATLKRVQYNPQKSRLVLFPENPKYEPFIYTGQELEDIRILGKAVYFMSAL